jgi:manganese/zinc/iron transport system permease protein
MIDFDYTLVTVVLGGALVGLLSGVLGAYAVLRKQSLLGDTISHAALPGIALAFLLLRAKHPLPLVLGAMAAGWLGTMVISAVVRRSRVKLDTIMAVVLAVFFGLGLTLLSVIQRLPTANQAGLTKFLYGNASTMLRRDVTVMAVFAAIALVTVLLFWKEFKLATFDPDYARSLGFPVRVLDMVLLSVIVIAITIGLQSVGVVLMSAMLVAPAAAAHQWTNHLGAMTLLAALFGMTAGVSGALLSSSVGGLPTGPATVCVITLLVVASLLFAAERGLLWQWLRRMRNRGDIALSRLLEQLYWLARDHESREHYHEVSLLQAISHERVERYVATLRRRGLVELAGSDRIRLSEQGLRRAEELVAGTGGKDMP